MIIINGSRREGNCYNLANRIKKELEKERIYCNIITPGNQKIHICTGCMDCDKNGICDFTDDMKKNIEQIKKEKILLFITPTRWNLLSGDLKLFMDRLNPLFSTHELKGKLMIAVAIGSKSKELYSTEAAISSLTSFAESAGMNCVLKKEFNNCLNAEDITYHENEITSFLSEIKEILKKES